MKTTPKTRNTVSPQPLVRAIRDSLRAGKTYRATRGLLGAGLLGLVASGSAQADFPAVIELSDLDGSTGFIVNGISELDLSATVSNAGDVNGDSVDDLIIGAPGANSFSGQSYVVFGGAGLGRGGVLDLSALDGTNGFALNGIDQGDQSGNAVSGAVDVNGDGVDDVIIGAPVAEINSFPSGQSYVVFGGTGVGSGGALELSALDGTNGFTLNGIDDLFYSVGEFVTGLGDVNGDGVDDFMIGSGEYGSYVVFGGSDVGRQGVIEVSTMNGTNGFALVDIENTGSVRVVGDVNGDGISEIMVGGASASPNGIHLAGQTYVVFGRPTVGSSGVLSVSALDGTNGFALNGIDQGDFSGKSVSGAGDVNDDGVDDIIIGATSAEPNGYLSGQSYVVFGGALVGNKGVLELSALDGTNGFAVNGVNPRDRSGNSVSAAGDVNGDGVDDLIIGASGAPQSYVVFGGRGVGSSGVLELSALDGTNGFTLNGVESMSVSAAGDVNGDGIDDVIMGARRADPNGFYSGQSYVVFGRAADSGPWPFFAALRALGDTNGDGTPEIAMIARRDGKTVAKVKDAADDTLISRFAFSADLPPVDVEVMGDSGLARSLVLLGRGPAAETRDLMTGDLLGSVAFNSKFVPVDLTVLPDQDGNGIPELGMLSQGAKGATRVEIRDAVTLSIDPINTLWFDASFEPQQVITLPDLNGNGSAEVGVVLTKADDTDRLAVRDTVTGEKGKTLAPWWRPELDVLQALPVTDAGSNPTGNVAMLLQDPATGSILVRVADAATNATVATVRGYNPDFAPVKLAQVADLNGNGFDDYALLGRDPASGQVTAEVRDDSGGVSRMWFSSDCTPLDLAAIADINANGTQELVMLGRCGTDGTLKAVVKDAKTGDTLNRMRF